jgi:hypothetical protein
MDDWVEFSMHLEALVDSITSGLEERMYWQRHGHHLERGAAIYPRDTVRQDPQPLEDLEPDQDEPVR